MTIDPDAFDALADAVADRVLRRLPGRSSPDAGGLIDAGEVADRLGVSRDWVYAHATDLGAVQLGRGTRPRLRFSAEQVAAVAAGKASLRQSHPGTRGRVPARQAKRSRKAVPLIQIRDM